MNKIIQTISSSECGDKKSRLLTTDTFIRDIKKYKQDKKFLSFVEKITENLNMIGHSYIQKLRGTKKLHNNDVFEFRSCIKGQRFLFKFGWQLNGRYGVIDSDLILCRYVAEHEQIGLVAQKINEIYEVNEIDIIEEIKACKISKVKHDFDVEQEKLYIYHYEYNMPILSVQQINIIQDDSNIVLVNGIAGSGKTNICIQKLISLCSSENGYKVLYSTFSQKLLDSTEKFLKDVYMEKINKILLNSSVPNFKEYVSNELALINLELNDVVVDETNISQLLKMISYNLENNLECKDLFGIYKNYCNKNCNKVIVVDYEVFERLVNDKKIIYFHPNYDKKIEKLSLGLIFKEIEGIILGSNISSGMISYSDYEKRRKNDVLDSSDLKFIYDYAKKYYEFIKGSNSYVDKNIIAIHIIENDTLKGIFDISILDEVQDFTEKELVAYKHLSKKIFAAGDPLQMINPTSFSLDSFKRIFNIKKPPYELDLNYRNTSEINLVVKNLYDLNKKLFGSHGNIINSPKTIDYKHASSIYYTKHKNILDELNDLGATDYTIVVSDETEIEKLKKYGEVLTVSQIKGLENDVIILYNILSDTYSKLSYDFDKKLSKEDSLSRYQFNLFYVGVTRARNHLLVIEEKLKNDEFNDFFNKNFRVLDENAKVNDLELGLLVLTDDRLIEKITYSLQNDIRQNIEYFINKIENPTIKEKQKIRCNIYRKITSDPETISNAIYKLIENEFYDDARYLARKINEEGLVSILDSIIYNKKIDYYAAYKIIMETNSKISAEIISDYLSHSRGNLIKENEEVKKLTEVMKWN